MTNKDGGAEADITVSVLENGDGSSIVKPQFDGEQSNKFKFVILKWKRRLFHPPTACSPDRSLANSTEDWNCLIYM